MSSQVVQDGANIEHQEGEVHALKGHPWWHTRGGHSKANWTAPLEHSQQLSQCGAQIQLAQHLPACSTLVHGKHLHLLGIYSMYKK